MNLDTYTIVRVNHDWYGYLGDLWIITYDITVEGNVDSAKETGGSSCSYNYNLSNHVIYCFDNQTSIQIYRQSHVGSKVGFDLCATGTSTYS